MISNPRDIFFVPRFDRLFHSAYFLPCIVFLFGGILLSFFFLRNESRKSYVNDCLQSHHVNRLYRVREVGEHKRVKHMVQ